MIEYVDAKTIVTKTGSEFWFDTEYNMNIYRGCHHGCIYCDSRSDVYGIDDFDKVKVKRNALEIIERDLKSKRDKGIVAMGAMSDPYNALENDLLLTRNALELIDKYGFGVALATKSDLVVRDIDILKRISSHSPVIIKITITTSNDELTQLIEPFAPSSTRRFKALKTLRDNGIYAGILIMPLLPFVNDTLNNLEGILIKAKYVDSSFIYGGFGVTQRAGQRRYYLDQLAKINPDIALMHEKKFGNTYSCNSTNGKELYGYFEKFCRENKIPYKMKDIINSYKKGYNQEQISLF